MTITLTPEQRNWIDDHVAAGEFASVEDAVQTLLDERIAERALEGIGDLSWAKPLVDEAIAQIDRGEVMTLKEYKSRIRARAAAVAG